MARCRSRADRLGPQARRSVRPQVELVEDRILLATFTVDSPDDPTPITGTLTLRQAINLANDTTINPGLDLINFNISNSIGGVVQTIVPLTPLPDITDPV